MLKRVWVIDDDPINNLICETLISTCEFADQVVCYRSADTALASLQSGAELPELVFLDLNMPGLSGWDFLERFKQLNVARAPRILLLTSSIDPKDIQRAAQEPLVEKFLSKPLTAAVLAQL